MRSCACSYTRPVGCCGQCSGTRHACAASAQKLHALDPTLVQAIRQVIQQRGYKLPDPPPRPAIAAYGPVKMQRVGSLLEHLPLLSKPVPSQYPRIMENYGQM